ncbi:MAG: TonB-dependent receptor, partial [Steroidobacteraceae bacterium]
SGLVTQESSVAVYVDDILVPHANGAFLDLIDVDRLEVLRGPQGTLFGRNTEGGAVRYLSKMPGPDLGGRFKATVGNNGRRDLTGILNLPLSDTVFTRLSYSQKHRDGYITRIIDGRKNGDENNSAVRGQLRWQPTDKLDIDLSVDATNSWDNGPAMTSIYNPGPNGSANDVYVMQLWGLGPFQPGLAVQALTPASANANFATRTVAAADAALNQYYSQIKDKYTVYGYQEMEHTETNDQGYSATINYALSDDLSLKSLTAYRKLYQNQVLPNWNRVPILVFAYPYVHVNGETYTQEFQLSGNSFNDRLKWVAGLYYFNDTGKDDRVYTTGGDGVRARQYRNVDTQSYAAFGQGTLKLTDRLSTTLGLRYSRDEKDFEAYRDGRGLVNGVSAPHGDSGSWDSVTPRVGFDFRWTPDLMTYVSAAKGFKAGGFNDTPLRNPIYGATPPAGISDGANYGLTSYDPETVWTYEGGVRSEFADRRIRLNGTVFYTDYTDIQLLYSAFINNIAITQTLNASSATIKGVEMDAVALVTDNLTLRASYAYTESKYGPKTREQTNGTFNDTVPFLRSPKVSYAIGANYNQPLASGAALVMDVNWGWKDDQYSSPTPSQAVFMPAYGLLNGRLEYRSTENWSVAAVGANLLNKYFVTGGIAPTCPASANTFDTGPHACVFGVGVVDVGRPREYGLEVNYKF